MHEFSLSLDNFLFWFSQTASLIDILYDVQNEHGVLVTISAAQKENIADAMEKVRWLFTTSLSELYWPKFVSCLFVCNIFSYLKVLDQF